MRPRSYLIKKGITSLPRIGDGRQSGTSGSPSILNASPEAATGGGLALLRTGDRVRIDLKKRTASILIEEDVLEERRVDFVKNGAATSIRPAKRSGRRSSAASSMRRSSTTPRLPAVQRNSGWRSRADSSTPAISEA